MKLVAPVGERGPSPSLAGGANAAVDVGARQRDEQPPLRIASGKAPDRVVAAPGVQSQQQVRVASGPLRGYRDAVSRRPKESRPAQGGVAIAVSRSRARRSD